MKKWRVEAVNVERVEIRLNEIEGAGGTIQQLLPASNPMNVYVVWHTAPAAQKA